MKKTGDKWATELGLNIINPTGWSNEKDFKSKKVTKIEFLNRAANSVMEFDRELTRREASKMLKKL
jgi:hypothetical protein